MVHCTYRHLVYERCPGLFSGVPDSLLPNPVDGLWHHVVCCFLSSALATCSNYTLLVISTPCSALANCSTCYTWPPDLLVLSWPPALLASALSTHSVGSASTLATCSADPALFCVDCLPQYRRSTLHFSVSMSLFADHQ
ncbi:hypothetical protein ROHU_008558 [Labeo rohita]|uniref:Uncharacterized protein n=1 Tax=Labeo rohita TaxID=84645 RepID=A0A498M9C8_LABRO|nr:hypothetical protein ROHU_008558 [Labeo rohita]